MKAAWYFLAGAMLAGVAAADELLDEVLRWDRPAAWQKTRSPVPPRSARPTPKVLSPEVANADDAMSGVHEKDNMSALSALPEMPTLDGSTSKEDATEEPVDGGVNVADMEYSSRLALSGGGGGDGAVVLAAEWTKPLGQAPFDLSLRGVYFCGEYSVEKSYKETYYTYSHWYSYWSGWHTTSHKHTRTVHYTEEEEFSNAAGETLLLWRPFRGKMVSPFVGAGGRIEKSETYQNDETDFSVSGRAGLALNLGRFALNGEIRGGKDSFELIGSATFRWGRYLALNILTDRFESHENDKVAFGGGVTLVF